MVASAIDKFEAAALFLAMMLAVVLDGGIVYWLCQHPAGQGASFGLTGQWTPAALPQAWLFGAFFMLACRLTAMFRPSTNNATEDTPRQRKNFLRLWRWTLALIARQGFALLPHRGAAS